MVGVACEDAAAGQPLTVNLSSDTVQVHALRAGTDPIVSTYYGESPLQKLRLKLGFTLPKVIKAVNPYDISEHCIALKQVADSLGDVAAAISEPDYVGLSNAVKNEEEHRKFEPICKVDTVFNVVMYGNQIEYSLDSINLESCVDGQHVTIEGTVLNIK